MNKQKLGLLGSAGLAAGVGAGLMYLLDPQGGGRRRAILRDQAMHAVKKGGVAARKTSRDLANRARGLVAETGSRLKKGEVDDPILHDRVRSKLGRAVSHPSAIEVAAEDGCVILSGPVLASEMGRLLSAVYSVRGVKEVENRLVVHESAENVPALQGEGRTAPPLWRRNKVGATLGALGLGLLARGLKSRTEGVGRGRASAGHGPTSRRDAHDLSAAGFEGALGQVAREFQTTLP